ncbi:hypothetical protein L211DRAFT_525811 [Terfezia boudieri ATCC MYA-4762]|uniref:Protein kinase domain-containing protein n=1 Tax=Terfezia boudieri ATCC MYA-4762 TaxID=1051890 RepID=A0A3N4LI21_9PEZI|nr:hypothetical protein L211DRAFT_525811 [Terfezia boudieri ATCC MYA-4762]
MELNVVMTEAGAGYDISSKDLRMCPEKIGSGSLNDVYRGHLTAGLRWPRRRVCVVKKIVRDSSLFPASFAVKQIKAAAAVLQSDKAPDGWFVKLVGVSADEHYFYLIQEDMAGGVLRKCIDEPWLEGDAKILGRQLFTSMKFMHDNQLMHLDLKPGVRIPSHLTCLCLPPGGI